MKRVSVRVLLASLLAAVSLFAVSTASVLADVSPTNPGNHYGRLNNPGHHYGQLKHRQPVPQPSPAPAPAPAPGQTSTQATSTLAGHPVSSHGSVQVPVINLSLPVFWLVPGSGLAVNQVEQRPDSAGADGSLWWLLLTVLPALAVVWVIALRRLILAAVVRRSTGAARRQPPLASPAPIAAR